MSHTIFEDGLGYEGKVTLTLKSNNRVLKSNVYKNSGTAFLFKFLGHCLIDDYINAKTLLPTKIMLLHNYSNFPDSANARAVEQRSSWQAISQQPMLISDNEKAEVRVIYSFEVPKSAIIGEFNQVALYGSGIKDSEITDFSAYYFLIDNTGAFDVQSTVDWSATTVLLIEWELTLSNKNTDIKNTQEGM